MTKPSPHHNQIWENGGGGVATVKWGGGYLSKKCGVNEKGCFREEGNKILQNIA